jgi:hypothetical protein
LAHDVRVAAGDEEALALMRDSAFDPRHDLVLDSATVPEGQERQAAQRVAEAATAQVAVTGYAPERVEVEVDTGISGYLVLTDAWYPGWKATIDGEPVPVHRANLYFRAVEVDAGHHRVVYTFHPVSLFVGAGISLLGLASIAILSKVDCNAIMTWGRVAHNQSAKEGEP